MVVTHSRECHISSQPLMLQEDLNLREDLTIMVLEAEAMTWRIISLCFTLLKLLVFFFFFFSAWVVAPVPPVSVQLIFWCRVWIEMYIICSSHWFIRPIMWRYSSSAMRVVLPQKFRSVASVEIILQYEHICTLSLVYSYTHQYVNCTSCYKDMYFFVNLRSF